MKDPKIMLDSTIGKILMAKQADATHINPASKPEQDIIKVTKPDQPEAEIRLVVRFTVEEHIVYQGKVQRVNQLDSEELSRVVSRVAWDSAKEENDTAINAHLDQTQKESDLEHAKNDCHQNLYEKSFGNITADNSASTSPEANVSNSPNDEASSRLQAIKATQDIDSSDHDAYVSSNENSNTSSTKNEDDNSIAQVIEIETIGSKTSKECDKTSNRSSDDTGAVTATNFLQDSPPISDISTDGIGEYPEAMMPRNTDFGLNPNPTPESIDDLGVDSQLIAETLNDCVNNVELECHQTDNSPQRTIYLAKVEDQADLKLDLNIEHEIDNSIEEKVECQIVKDTNISSSPEMILKQDEKPTPASSGVFRDDKVQTIQACTTNDFSTNEINKDACNVSNKRKAAPDHNPSGKRIRKTNAKERSSNTRNNSSRTTDNVSTRQKGATPRQVASKLSSASSEQMRHHKVFAKWADNHYYPGTILRPTKDRKFVIGFFDGAHRNVSEVDLIPLSNIEGKHVRVSIAKNYCVNALVHGQCEQVSDQPMFDVEYQQDGLVRTQVPLKDIFLTGEQGTPLISQKDKNSGESNFADVDLDNIIYDKRSRRLQDLEEFYFTNTPTNHRTKTSLLL